MASHLDKRSLHHSLSFIEFILYARYKLPKVSDSYAKLLGQEVDGGEGLGRRRKEKKVQTNK